jgi:hypothetical protein
LLIKRILLVFLLGAAGYGCVSPQSLSPNRVLPSSLIIVVTTMSGTLLFRRLRQWQTSRAWIEPKERFGGCAANTWRGAEAIAIFISPTDVASPHFRVSVVSEHVLKTQLLGKDFKDRIISQIENQLGIPSSLSSSAEGPP